MVHRPLALLLTLLLASSAVAQETKRQYLSGHGIDDAVPWEFFVSAGHKSGQWTTIPVPSCWEMHGFGELAYGRPPKARQGARPDEQAKYRHRFRVPGDWNRQTIYIVFDGSMTDTRAFVNGRSAGPVHQGAFYRFRYDVTPLVKPGGENLLEVTVDKESANDSVNRAERRGDYWNFGGIFRPVYLEARPPQHVARVAIDAGADGAFAMDVFTGGVTSADMVRAQVTDLDGKSVGKVFSQPLSDRGATRLTTKIDAPRQWTAETPNLYQVEVTLMEGDKPLHRMRQRFGFRTIQIRPGEGLFINGQRVMLKGTNRHTFWPESGRASSEKLSRADIALMKEMNNNAVRMSHYPPDEHFLDLCDEMGLYVLDELAGWQAFYDEPTGRRLIEQMVTRDVNHPSILFWDNGNEGGWNTALDDDFAKWDPQRRPVLHPWETYRGIDTKHYPNYELLVNKASGADVFMPTEFQHALFDGGGAVALTDYWDVLRRSTVAAGAFLWAFVDEALKRPERGGAGGAGGAMDTVDNLAPDGVLGPYREKEGSFFAIKEIWSPIVVTRGRDAASDVLTIENRYDFTNADQCRFTWQLRKFRGPNEKEAGFTVVAEGKLASPSIAPHASGTVKLDLPAAERDEADALALRVDDPSGAELWTWVWALKRPAAMEAVAPKAKIVHARQDEKSIAVSAGDLSLTFSRATGQLTSVRRGDKEFPLRNGPRLAVGDAKLASITYKAASDGDHVVSARYTGNLKSVDWRVKPDGRVQLDYAYNLSGTYDFFGVSFDLPERDVLGMKWLGDGPFRVWKNRREGVTLNVWEKRYNDTQTGYSGWIYPEFKGYYANLRWMQLQTSAGPILVSLNDPSLFVQVLRPKFPGEPKPFSPTTAATRAIRQSQHLSANAWATFPQAGFSILHGIAPMGTKFQIARQLGPQSRQNVAAGDYRGTIRLYFGAGDR